MSHIDQHKAAYQAFIEGEYETAFKEFADDIIVHGVAKGLPFGDDYEGKQAVLEGWLPAVGETLDGLALDPAKFIEDGDWVVVFGHQSATAGGTKVNAPFAHVWRWEGDEIAEAWFFSDGAQVAGALR
ncbi:MAG: uncharacterized protein QOI80_2207 [Solirubrobacteraceae bacterium]|nr:uncharacterized protein [Solirubrobacteraceae bacterium]